MRFIHTLIDTVISRMQPMMKGCQKGETPFRLRPLRMTPSRMTPTTVPRMAPWLHEAGVAELWAGMIDVTPDAVPYICEAPALPGLIIGTGMSGHGFGIGPAVGRILADLATGRSPGFDLSRFRFQRFTDGSPVVPGPY